MKAGGGGFENWGELRNHLIEQYGDTPRPETEAVIIAAYELHPTALEHAAQSVAIDVTTGTIRSGWAVLRSRANSIASPPSNPSRPTSVDREKRIARAEQWIRNAGTHYDQVTEVEDELFNERGLLRDHPDLKERMLHTWAEERHTGMQLEHDQIARAEAWKAAQHLIRQKLAAATAEDDRPL